MKKDTRSQDRAKKLIAGSKSGKSSDTKIKTGKSTGLSGAMPKSFAVSGSSPKKRADKKQRYASGGGIDDSPKKKGNAKTEVNIVIAGKGDQGAAPAAPPMMPPAAAMPPRPPMPPQGGMPGGMPPGGMPPGGMRPPGAMKRGGGVKENPEYPIDAGAGGGKGRLEKAAAQKPKGSGKHDK